MDADLNDVQLIGYDNEAITKEVKLDVEKITLFHLKNYSELFGLLWDSRQMWSPENHHTFSKSDRKTISTFLLLHHKKGISKLHSDLWGIIFSYIIPIFLSSLIRISDKDCRCL